VPQQQQQAGWNGAAGSREAALRSVIAIGQRYMDYA
jgi:hypothetical protein